MTVKWNVQVPMRDGTALSADVHFAGPAGTPATTLLARTPYNKNTLEARKPALAYAAKVRAPALILQGGSDLHVPPISAERIAIEMPDEWDERFYPVFDSEASDWKEETWQIA